MPYNNDRQPWNAEAARAQAHAHAAAFLRAVAGRLETYASERGSPGLCVFAIDTELLGHWWYEGPWWLGQVIEHAAASGIELVTLGQGVSRSAPVDRPLRRSSWGLHKTLDTWDSPPVSAIAWRQRSAELELADALVHQRGDGAGVPAVAAARELLALQSSDWAFITNRKTAGDYAQQRLADHGRAFDSAIGEITDSVPQSAADGSEPSSNHQPAALAPDLTAETLSALANDHC